MLAPLRSALGQTLRWVRPSIFRREYELRVGRDRVATLRLTGLFRRRAEGEVGEDRWVLSARGIYRSVVVVTRGDSDVEVATVRTRLFGEGLVRIGPGRSFSWKPDNFWRTRWTMWDETHSPVFHLERRVLVLPEDAAVLVEPSATRLPELSLLLLLAWHSIVLHRRRHIG
jgi:hypothetical protein